MPNVEKDPLFILIKTLTKSEKRNFKLFVRRTNSKEEAKFIQLFDALDTMESLDDKVLFKKVPKIKRAQLSNMKAHLYKQILIALRLNHNQHNVDIQLSESLDFAKVLYNKGLYKQSLKLLNKTKVLAMNSKHNTIVLQILEFEKLIESQYITRSIHGRADELVNQSLTYLETIKTTNLLSNLALQLYGLYLKMGYVRNESDYKKMKTFMKENLPQVKEDELSFFERLYLYQSHVWYNYIIQDFIMCYRYAQKWVDLFKNNPDMIEQRPSLYLKGLHNLLAALFNLGHYPKFVDVFNELEQVNQLDNVRLNRNIEVLLFLYVSTNRINKHFLEGSFSDGLEFVPQLEKGLKEYYNYLDPHRVLIFYYKIASLYFGSGDNLKAIEYLEKVIKYKDVSLREDIHCFARILNLIAHYEAGLDNALEYQVKSVYHFLGKMNDLHKVQIEIFKFLKKLNRITVNDLKQEFKALRDRLKVCREDVYESRPFLYLDIISWLESKINNITVQEVIRENFEQAGKTKTFQLKE
ncbi:MAG: hypothetical protein OEX22_02390 [Cyclobacteriaceae bacterium]|nr:hypothetical protein [Cyclobacteriaceae bacterium]